MNSYRIWLILFLCVGFAFTTGCISKSPSENRIGNSSIVNQSTPTPTLPVTYSASNPLSLNDTYRYISGENEIMARFAKYELTERYGEASDTMYRDSYQQIAPDRIYYAPPNSRFLFVHFSFINLGKTPTDMPGAEMFRIISNNQTYVHSNDSFIFRSSIREISQINGTLVNMPEEYSTYFPMGKLYPKSHNFPDFPAFIQFTVSDKFDPATSFISVRFDENSSAVWKFT